MIIAVSGPASTGKSSFINLIKTNKDELLKDSRFEYIRFIGEIGRDLYKEISTKYNIKSFNEILSDKQLCLEWTISLSERYRLIVRKLKYEDSEEALIIIDRCHLDLISYGILNLIEFDLIDHASLHKLYEFDKSYPIDKILVTKVSNEFSIEDDGFRPMQYESRRLSERIVFYDHMISLDPRIINLPDHQLKRLITFNEIIKRRY